MQEFETLATILSQALGGGKKTTGKSKGPPSKSPPKGEVHKVSSADEMKKLWREIF